MLPSAQVKIFRTVTRNAVNKSVWMKKRLFLTSLKQTCNEYLIKFPENQSAPKLENRKTSPCSPCAPNLLHVLVSRILGYHNLCSPGSRNIHSLLNDKPPSRQLRRLRSCETASYTNSHGVNNKLDWWILTITQVFLRADCSLEISLKPQIVARLTHDMMLKHRPSPRIAKVICAVLGCLLSI